MKNRTMTMRRVCAGLLGLSGLWLSGCGGGGHFASPSVQTVSGRVQSASGIPLSGYQVVYDPTSDLMPIQGPGVTTTTDSQGNFTLSVFSSQITGHDTLSIFDSTDSLVSSTNVVPGGAASVIVVTPPAPPAPPM